MPAAHPAPAEVQPPPILQDIAEQARLYFQELGFDEENIRTAMLLHDGDSERAGSWLLAQLEDDNEERAEALPGPSIAAPQGPAAPAVDRRVLAGRAEVRELLKKKERREKEEARIRAEKAQEQAEIDRKRARARAQAERNQTRTDAAEEAARAGRGAHAEAAEGRAVRAGPVSGLQPGPSGAEDSAAARAAAMRTPVDSLAPAAAPPAAAPPAPGEAAAMAAAGRAAAAAAEAKAKAEAEPSPAARTSHLPRKPPSTRTQSASGCCNRRAWPPTKRRQWPRPARCWRRNPSCSRRLPTVESFARCWWRARVAQCPRRQLRAPSPGQFRAARQHRRPLLGLPQPPARRSRSRRLRPCARSRTRSTLRPWLLTKKQRRGRPRMRMRPRQHPRRA